MDEEPRKLLVINTHKGLFRYNRLAFGVVSAPAALQKTMDTMLSGIPHAAAYLDDIIVTGSSDEEHLKTLDQVLKRMEEYGFRIRKEKCEFMKSEVEYLGHKISAEWTKVDPKKTAAIVKMPEPENVPHLRSFLGMCNYYAEFLLGLATLCAPLNKLLKEGDQWRCTKAHSEAVISVKEMLTSPALLTRYRPELPIYLAANASNVGIGAVVYQKLKDGSVKVPRRP